MRSSPFRLALPLAALLVATAASRLTAADPAPVTAAPPAPAPITAAPSPTAPAATTTTTIPNPAPTKEPAPMPTATATTTAPVPVTTSNPAPVPVPAATTTTTTIPAPEPVPDQDTAEAKLAVVLRSYSLVQEENDRLKAALEKAQAEKSSVDAQFSVAKDALPIAAQAASLREQLRQTQDQLAAVSLENNQLKTRLATGAPAPGTANLTPTNVPTSLPPVAAPAPAPAARIHVVKAGDTLSKIAKQYYGNPNHWPEILAANRDVLKDEKSLVAGTKLRIP